MSPAVVRRLPVAACVATIAGLIASVALSVGQEAAFDTVLYTLMSLSMAVAGLLVARRQPGNPVGWILCALGLTGAWAELTEGYGYHANLPLAVQVQWLTSWAYLMSAGQFAALFLLTPSGRLPGPRWRWFIVASGAGAGLSIIGSGLGPFVDFSFASGSNPYAVDWVGITVLYVVGQILFLGCLIVGALSLCVRWKRASGIERTQLSVVLVPVAALVVIGPLAVISFGDSVPVQIGIATVVTAIPLAVCVSILRFRLYDVEVVLNRALVYGSLSVLLAVAYVATSLLIGTTLGQSSSWATAAGTLVAAAAFNPARRRLQEFVDRTFSRARYDAMARVATFLEDLRAGRVEAEEIEALLRSCLSDDDLELQLCLPTGSSRVDVHGHDVIGSEGTEVERAGVLLAVVVHGPRTGVSRRTLNEVLDRASLAVEMARLQVDLRRQLGEVEASRARLLQVGYAERRRLERDLHDGAQQRLVSIGLALRHAQHELGDTAVSSILDDAVTELGVAINDLRSLANGVRPPELQVGLGYALRELAGRSPVPVRVWAGPERYPNDVEAAAYFVASEGITNAVKHASATVLDLRAHAHDGVLVICVSDDGIGGAELNRGSGLRGLADRVAAHGGFLTLDSRAGHGTTLTAELPCAS